MLVLLSALPICASLKPVKRIKSLFRFRQGALLTSCTGRLARNRKTFSTGTSNTGAAGLYDGGVLICSLRSRYFGDVSNSCHVP